MVLTASFVLSLVTGLVCHHRRAETSARLDASVGASGPHDFAVRGNIVRLRAFCARPTLPRPPHPIPTFVTMANAPLSGRDGGRRRGDLAWKGRKIFLKAGLDRANQIESLREIRLFAHRYYGLLRRARAFPRENLEYVAVWHAPIKLPRRRDRSSVPKDTLFQLEISSGQVDNQEITWMSVTGYPFQWLPGFLTRRGPAGVQFIDCRRDEVGMK
jgi:hypothetical protein